jgi:hypothetical protein
LHGVVAALEHVAKPEWLAKGAPTGETVLSAFTNYEHVGKDVINLATSLPVRLAAALRHIIATEGGMQR